MLATAAILILVLRACKGLIVSVTEGMKPVLLKQLELVERFGTIASAHDLMAYQGIVAMDRPIVGYDGDQYNPSEEEEARREAERLGIPLEELNGLDDGALDPSLFE